MTEEKFGADSGFMRGFMRSLVFSLTLWAAAISLAFSVFG